MKSKARIEVLTNLWSQKQTLLTYLWFLRRNVVRITKERDNIFLIFVPMMSEMDIIDRIEVPRRDYCNYDHKERHYWPKW